MKTHEDILTHQSLARISARARVLGNWASKWVAEGAPPPSRDVVKAASICRTASFAISNIAACLQGGSGRRLDGRCTRPIRAARARGSVPSGPHHRPRRPPRAAPSRSPVRLALRVHYRKSATRARVYLFKTLR